MVAITVGNASVSWRGRGALHSKPRFNFRLAILVLLVVVVVFAADAFVACKKRKKEEKA